MFKYPFKWSEICPWRIKHEILRIKKLEPDVLFSNIRDLPAYDFVLVVFTTYKLVSCGYDCSLEGLLNLCLTSDDIGPGTHRICEYIYPSRLVNKSELKRICLILNSISTSIGYRGKEYEKSCQVLRIQLKCYIIF